MTIYIRPYFVEDYENDRKGRKNGEFIQFIYICKITTIRNLKNRNSLLIFESHYKFNLIWDCFVGTKITISQLFGKL